MELEEAREQDFPITAKANITYQPLSPSARKLKKIIGSKSN